MNVWHIGLRGFREKEKTNLELEGVIFRDVWRNFLIWDKL